VNDTLQVTTAASVYRAGTVTVVGNVTPVSVCTITVPALTFTLFPYTTLFRSAGTTTFNGSSSLVQGTLTTNVIVTGTAAFNASTTISGNLTTSITTIDLKGKTVGVTGNLLTNGGALKMQNAAGLLTVNGSATV